MGDRKVGKILKKLWPRTLQSKSSVVIIVTVAVLLELISNVQIYFARKGIREEVEHRAEAELRLKSLEVQKVMVAVETAVENNVWDVEQLLSKPDSLYSVFRRMVEKNPTIVGVGMMFTPDYYPQKGHWYEPYVAQQSDGTMVASQIGSASHNYLEAEFYRSGMSAGQGHWSDPYYDDAGAKMMLCTYTMPIRDSRGDIVALLGADVSLGWLSTTINANHIYPSSFNVVISRTGLVLVFPDESITMRSTIQELTASASDTTVLFLNRQMMSGQSGHLSMLGKDDEEKMVIYGPVDDGKTGWSMSVVCSKREVFAEMDKVGRWLTLLMLAGIGLLGYIIYRTARSARKLQEANSEKERMESELRIARDIQMSMVPDTFPVSDGLDMFAVMTPAKEVGGDLYGYLLQGDSLYFCVGDVSGKGVPASLFMAQVTRLFRTLAVQGMMPAEICTRMNNELTEDNSTNMFVTLFIGLVDLTTGHLALCNAGHNPPVVGETFLKTVANLPIGVVPDYEYEGGEVENIKGKPLFVYTDGLSEAENRRFEQFGEERLLRTLATAGNESAREVINTLVAAVDKHRDGAEPNDDLTMLYMKL
jgi:sigma-B regulation protein RsbU (phosphoserine phosphatase)